MSIYTDTAIQCLRDEAEALLALIPTIGSELDEAVRLIMACTGKVIVTGVGKADTSAPKSPRLSLPQEHPASLSIRSTRSTETWA